ncbi:cytochrome P450 [Mycena floridula]|nr:cytochrome P450 [Mycena floridula]
MADLHLLPILLLAVSAYIFYKYIYVDPRLRAIPTIGPSSILVSLFFLNRFISHGRVYLEEGYRKHRDSAFKLALPDRWLVLVSGSRMIEEIRRAPDDQLSAKIATDDGLAARYTLGKELTTNHFHIDVVRGTLTKQFGGRFLETRDEILAGFEDEIPVTNDWVEVGLRDSVRRIIARSSNRLFVGLPLCRDPNYRDLNITLSLEISQDSEILRLCPLFLQPLVAALVGKSRLTVLRGIEMLRPLLQSRLDDYNSGNSSPNDLITWLIDEAPPERRTIYELAIRVLFVNNAAIHTTSVSFTYALYYLAAYPEYVAPLREEIETIVDEYGWTKSAMGKMVKLDSFLKESQRMTGVGAISMGREVLKDFTFSDGTMVPAGNLVAVASFSIHTDESLYPNALQFQGFRYSDMRNIQGEGLKHHFVTTGPEFMLFGHGKHACPGRFFAANTMAIMFAQLLTTYDVKFADDRKIPPDPVLYGFAVLPDTTAELVFRARQ